jgi:MoaA/NifB/PqqE/SkfB family radical SAM enzyme
MRADLMRAIGLLKARSASSISLLTNGRLLVYAPIVRALLAAGVNRLIVKLFAADAAAHDAHTRAPGSFEQTCRGIRNACALGADVGVTFPLSPEGLRGTPASETRGNASLARLLTRTDPVRFPERRVLAHAGEFRYDLIQRRGSFRNRLWTNRFFPMAHVPTGPLCNLRCVYCNVRGGEDQRIFERAYVELLIEKAAQAVLAVGGEGRPTLDIIGGEPTLHPDLPQLVRRARACGFRHVTICTNGVRLLRANLLDRLIEVGLTGIRYSLHDHRAEIAEKLAGVKGTGSRYPELAEHLLSRSDIDTHFFRLILRENADALPEYLEFLAERNKSGRPVDLMLGMPSMRGRVMNRHDLYPPLEGLRARVAAAVLRGRQLGMEILLHHAPGCLMPEEPERHSCWHILTSQVSVLSGIVEELSFEGEAEYAPNCNECTGKVGGCAGLPRAYWEQDPEQAASWVIPLRYRPGMTS